MLYTPTSIAVITVYSLVDARVTLQKNQAITYEEFF